VKSETEYQHASLFRTVESLDHVATAILCVCVGAGGHLVCSFVNQCNLDLEYGLNFVCFTGD